MLSTVCFRFARRLGAGIALHVGLSSEIDARYCATFFGDLSEMQNSSILYREESRPPRLLTWPVVLGVAGVIALTGGRELHERQPGGFTFLLFAGVTLSVVLLLEF